MNVITRSLVSLWSSSIGKKLIVALTGVVLVLFLAGHLAGNMLIYAGEKAFNDYAYFLHHMLHGAGIWIARIVLLTCLVLHVAATIALTRQNRSARPKYEFDATMKASRSSKIMIWSGLTILAFVIFHILHFTVRTDADLARLGADNPHAMVVLGFQNFLVVLFYIIAMTLLCSHLAHGVASIFQTLGLRDQKTAQPIELLSKAYAVIIWVGFISVPLSIKLGLVG